MARRAKKRTDLGTVVLHWLLVIALLFAALTGLRITSTTPGYEWLLRYELLLPASDAWSWHILSGIGVFGFFLAYIAYIVHAGLLRRVWLDKGRILGLFGRNQARLGALNIIFNWCLFALLALVLGTGFAMYLGHGGQLVALHRIATWGLLAFPLAHIVLHFAIGGPDQIMRIFRPGDLAPAPPPFDPFEALAALREANPAPGPALPPPPPSPAREPDSRRRSETTLQTHPLTVAAAVGFSGVAFLMAFDSYTGDTLQVRRISASDAPRLDGDVADPAWIAARPVHIQTHQGQNFDGKGETRVEVRAVHDGKRAYFSFVWDDPTRSLKHLPLLKQQQGWFVIQDALDYENENAFHDDAFAVMLTTLDRPDAGYAGGNSFHIGPKPLADKPASYSGRGLHYTETPRISDVWYWKASRGGLAGWCDDAYIGPPVAPNREQAAGKARYFAGFAFDPGAGMDELNFAQRPPGGYLRPVQPKRLPRDPRQGFEALGKITPSSDKSESDGAVWWLTRDNSEAYSFEQDARFAAGSLIPGVILTGEPSGDRADLRCAARWAAGRWTLELSRLLDTGSPNDIPLGNNTGFRVAAFDHSQIGHTRHLRIVTMTFE